MHGIGIASTIFDTSGNLYIEGSSLDPADTLKNNSRERRFSRTATLDGGVSVYDTGYAPGDRDMSVKVSAPAKDIPEFFFYICETYNLILIMTEDGAFTGVPEKAYIDDNGAAILKIAITAEA